MSPEPQSIEIFRIEVGGRVVVHQAVEQLAPWGNPIEPNNWLHFAWSEELAEIARREESRVGNTYLKEPTR